MKKIFCIIFFIGVSQSTHSMEEEGNQELFLPINLQTEWAKGIKQVVEWSQGLPSRYENKIIKVYEDCYEKIKQLQSQNGSNILEKLPAEVTLAKKLLSEIKEKQKYMNELKPLLAPHKILYPADPNTKDTEWKQKYNKSFLMLNNKTTATTAVIAASLIPYKMHHLKKEQTKK